MKTFAPLQHIARRSLRRPFLPLSKVVPDFPIRQRSDNVGSNKNANALRDRRLAGRQRFYRNVSIELLQRGTTLWSNIPSSSAPDNKDNETIASPISAGVDGSDSATGVSHLLSREEGGGGDAGGDAASTTHHLRYYLSPRAPTFYLPADSTQLRHNNLDVVSDVVDWYCITLDGRKIQTPLGQTLMVPSALWATQIAAEWDAVQGTINPTQMPCMTLTCTVLDQTAHTPEPYQTQVTQFVPTDTLCYWADPVDDGRALLQAQERAWRPVHTLVQNVTGMSLATASGTLEGVMLARRGLPHDPRLLEYADSFVLGLDAWHLTALQSLAVEAKSFWWAWALLWKQQQRRRQSSSSPASSSSNNVSHHPGLFPEVSDAVHAARVEEEFQIRNWGLVEGQHDYDRLNTSINVSAALMLVNSLAVDGCSH